jgi:8-oxo-dGTP diphosphatase
MNHSPHDDESADRVTINHGVHGERGSASGISKARELARQVRERDPGKKGGWVVVYRAFGTTTFAANGWMWDLNTPENWLPGCLAVAEDGRVAVAVGGDPQRGAERWEEITEEAAKKGFKSYVLCFAFSPDLTRVALIQKQKPEWQRGLLNGIGGKIEAGESALDAVRREFAEETGNSWPNAAFTRFAQMVGPGVWSVDCFHLVIGDRELDGLKCPEEGQTGECIRVLSLAAITAGRADMVENLPWLIALARDVIVDGRPEMVTVVYPTATVEGGK